MGTIGYNGNQKWGTTAGTGTVWGPKHKIPSFDGRKAKPFLGGGFKKEQLPKKVKLKVMMVNTCLLKGAS